MSSYYIIKRLSENKQYSHTEVEAKWTKSWLDNDLYRTQVNKNKARFSIALPPPNVTGELHMGHALGGTIQDLLIRYHRMLGKDVLWQIGTDHAGIGTQLVVEKHLKKTEGKSKEDLGREEFIKRTQAWKEEYGNKIIEQMKVLGFSPDYNRVRYTMDEHYAESVKQAFIKYFNDGLIYRGNRIVNWCPKCLTSLSDLEIAKEACAKKLYEIKYMLTGTNQSPTTYITVATTRPETMFGDVAVAINPNDERYKDIITKLKNYPQELGQKLGAVVLSLGHEIYKREDYPVKVLIPIINKKIPVILDEHVKMDFGTGALKVTPAHDANDYEIAQRHGLDSVIIMDNQAKLNTSDCVPEWLQGSDRYKARELVLEKLTELKTLNAVSEYNQEKDLHDRCNTEIEPYLSDQWYLSMKGLSKQALAAESSGRVNFIPERYSSMFKNWLENIQDWCISRQIWWGHQIPVYYYEDNINNIDQDINYFIDSQGKCIRFYAADISRDPSHWQDPDVLDTWFSSALWPFETLKDKEAIFKHYYPTDVLATAREIINLWVSRMIYSSEYFEHKEPFKDILIHPVVQTPDGKRMSKSKGNAIDPLEMVAKYGADASRMWYASVGIHGQQDVRFPGRKDAKEGWLSDTFEQYRKFANKLFNASKFVMMQLPEDFKPTPLDESQFTAVDRWIIYKFSECLRSVEYNFQNYSFEKIQEALYNFLWFDFCDWYIEFTKVDVGNKATQQQILFTVLEQSLRALHPIMPFITEEIWQILKAKYDWSLVKGIILNTELEAKYQEFIAFAKYPSHKDLPNVVLENSINIIQLLLSQLRNIRQTLNIAWSQEMDIYLVEIGLKTDQIAQITLNQEYIRTLAKVNQIHYNEYNGNEKCYKLQYLDLQIQIPISSENASKLSERYKKDLEKIAKDIQVLESKLKSDGFVKNASAGKIEEARMSLEDCISKKSIFEEELNNLNPSLT